MGAPHAVAGSALRVATRVQNGAASASRVGTPGTHLSRRGNRTTVRTNRFNSDGFFEETEFDDVPGLGFDYPHLAAISGNRHFRHQPFGTGFPFGFGGFFLPTEPVIIEEAQPAAAPQSEDEVTTEASDVDPLRESRSHRRGSAQSPDAQPEPSSALPAEAEPNAAEYILVRRDGGLLFAVAYSWQNGTLRYVTRDGIRRTVAGEALDLSATEQFNEQRGLTFHLPA
jgi:hypothetical protein